jgi:hypothetical protein
MKLLHVEKKIEDTKMVALKNTYVNPSQISKIIKTDADVYTKDGV